jgi:hypothetical protein
MNAAALDEANAAALSRACTALWLATLSLMTAYMRNTAPAHRYLLARKIAGNFDLLGQQECYTAECRDKFSRLSRRWTARAEGLARQEDRPRGGFGLVLPALFNSR